MRHADLNRNKTQELLINYFYAQLSELGNKSNHVISLNWFEKSRGLISFKYLKRLT